MQAPGPPSILETSEWQPPPPLWWALGSKVRPTTRNKKLSFILKSVLVEPTARAQFCCKCPQLKHRTTLCRCCHLIQGRSSRGANTEPRTPLNMVGVLHDGLRCFPGFKCQRHVLSANIVIKNTYLQHFAKIFRPVGPPLAATFPFASKHHMCSQWTSRTYPSVF